MPPRGPNIALRDSRWSMDRVECGGVPLRVPLRPAAGGGGGQGQGQGPGNKKMRKRKELDALAKRCPGNPGTPDGPSGVHKRCSSGGLSSHDQLLSESSGDDSGTLPGYKPGYKPGYTLGYTPGFAVKRRRPARGPHLLRRQPCVQVMRACVGLLVLACVIATITVMWLFIDIREQVFSLRTQIEQVVAGSQAVPDDLQKIHSLSRELQQNQTQLTLKVTTITAQIANLSQQLMVVQTNLRAYSDQVQSNPEPANVKELMANVALWGSQIKDLDNTVKSLKQQQESLSTSTQTLQKNLTIVEASVTQLSNISLRPQPLEPNVAHTLDNLRQMIAQTSANVTEANSTLTKRLQWLQDDQTKDHKAIEGLQDLGQNVTARIKTLEGECAKIDVQNALNTTVSRLKEQVNQEALRLRTIELTVFPEQPSTSVTQSTVPAAKSEVANPGSLIEEVKDNAPGTSIDSVSGGVTTPGG